LSPSNVRWKFQEIVFPRVISWSIKSFVFRIYDLLVIWILNFMLWKPSLCNQNQNLAAIFSLLHGRLTIAAKFLYSISSFYYFLFHCFFIKKIEIYWLTEAVIKMVAGNCHQAKQITSSLWAHNLGLKPLIFFGLICNFIGL